MRPRIARLLGASALITLAAGCGDPQLAPTGDDANLAQGGPEPRAPSNLSATSPSASEIHLSWQDNSPNETGFEVQRAPQQSGPYTLVTTTAANARSFTDGGRTAGTEYCYQVRALKRSGSKSTFSAVAGPACVTTPVPPAAAFELTALPLSSSSIRVAWSQSSPDESGFRVQRGPSETGPWTTVATTSANVTQAEDIVPTDLLVCYRVLAFNGNGEAQPSNNDCTAAPAAPTNLVGQVTEDQQSITLTWGARPADPPPVNDGIQVMGFDPSLGWTEIALLPAGAITYQDVGLVREWYVVRATRDGGYSDYSNFVFGLPAGPSNMVAFPFSSSSAFVYWTDNSASEDGFRLQRAPSPAGPWETIAETWTDYPYFEDYGLVTEDQVCYRAVAFNGNGASAPAEPDCTAPPAAPTGLTPTPVDHQSINVTWDAHPDTKDGYTVRDGYWLYRFDPWNGYYVFLAELAADVTSYSDVGLESQTEYHYLLQALNDNDPFFIFGSRGYSDGSNASATTNAAPGTTTDLTRANPRPYSAAARGAAARSLLKALGSSLPSRTPISPASRKPPPLPPR
jgi:hypothetical protein